MKKRQILKIRTEKGFSLAEVLAAVIIGSMVVVAVLGIYNRAERSVAAIRSKLEETRKPREVLQRITEDIDSVTGQGAGASVKLETKTNSEGYKAGRLEIVRGY
jgi:Tfp pilus assembly protein PilW